VNTRTSFFAYLLCPLFCTPACNFFTAAGDGPPTEPEPVASQYQVVKDLLPANVRDVDILFVVDNSGSMREEQASMAAWADESLFGVLGMPDGTPLDLHVAVVSTDLGAGDYGIMGCTGEGDGGRFQDGVANSGCTPIAGGFLSDIEDAEGERLTNYAGSLGGAFACLAEVGTSGCGFEQPLEAMKRALDGTNPSNAGFLREDALLAVVLVGDEDDCSVADTTLFDSDPAQDNIASALGSLSSFRCFDFGVQCDGDDPRTPGAKAECEARANSAYLATVEGYAEFLKGLKADPTMVYVAGIFGEPSSVSVSMWEGDLRLDPSCVSPSGEASPGVRLQGFLESFPDRHRFASVCSEDMSGPLGNAAAGINATVGRGLCLSAAIKDIDESRAGVQADCKATATEILSPEEEARALPQCSTQSTGPCYRVKEDLGSCANTPGALALDLSSAGEFAEGYKIQLACQVR
jgi:hypothetical protein